MTTTTFGQWLKHLRQTHNLTQRQLGLLVNCAEETIRKIETDRRVPSRQVVGLLADVLNLQPPAREQFIRLARPQESDELSTVAATGVVPPTTNLPTPVTPLIGRDDDLRQVLELLATPTVRLVTIRGVGGVGKTRLAWAVASAVHALTKQIAYVSLAHLVEPEVLVPTIAHHVGVHGATEPALFAALQAYLQREPLLLVLDNFEQIIDGAPALSLLLSTCPHLQILVTSRVALRISGEHEYMLQPLPLPDRDLREEHVAMNPAVALFLQRLHAIRPRFSLNASNTAAIVALCHQLDGLPLALELAAARCRVSGVESLLQQLSNQHNELAYPLRDAPLRHQSLRATLAWSYDLLPPNAQQVLARMALFCGSIALDVLIPVCCPDQPDEAIVVLATLLENSLIHHDDDDDTPRFRLLATVRSYAHSQLSAADLAATQHRYARVLCERAEAFHCAMRENTLPQHIKTLTQDYPDIHQALAWAHHHDHTLLVRFTNALWFYWYLNYNYLEGIRWVEHALAVHVQVPTQYHAALFEAANGLYHGVGDIERACDFGERSIALRRQDNADQRLAAILNNQALVLMEKGDYAGAYSHYHESLTCLQQDNYAYGIAMVQNNLGYVALLQHHWGQAHEWFSLAKPSFEHINDATGTFNLYDNMIKLALLSQDYDQAHTLLRESLALSPEVYHGYGMIEIAENTAAWLLVSEQNVADAVQLWAWADHQRLLTGVMMLNTERSILHPQLQTIAQAVDAEQWQALSAVGKGWSVQQCIDIVHAHLQQTVLP